MSSSLIEVQTPSSFMFAVAISKSSAEMMRLPPWDLGTLPQVVLVVEVVVGVELVGGALVEEDEEPYVVVAERSFPIPKGARFDRCCT